MSTYCAAAAPTHYPPGEAHSLPATAPLVTTFVAGPLPVNRASEAASRRLAAHPIRTRRPLSPFLSPSATPQLHLAQPLWARVAQNASGDTRTTPRRCREPFATGKLVWRGASPVAKGSRPPQPLHRACACPIAGARCLAHALMERPIDFWTFGSGLARPETQKSPPFFQPISSQHSEKQRLKRAAIGGERKDFWTTFMGPPGAHANPKVQKES